MRIPNYVFPTMYNSGMHPRKKMLQGIKLEDTVVQKITTNVVNCWNSWLETLNLKIIMNNIGDMPCKSYLKMQIIGMSSSLLIFSPVIAIVLPKKIKTIHISK